VVASGADPRRLPKETQGYISGVNLAQGGEVRHFANDGYVDPMGAYGGDYEERDTTFDPFQRALADYKKQALEKAKTQKALSGTSLAVPATVQNVPTRNNPTTNQDFRDFDQAAALFQAENMGRNAPTQVQEAPKSRLDQYMERMLAREAAMETQRGDDKNIALLTAGLGMLGGTSPYAFENIGKGALAGVQQLSESKKQRAAEQSALDKSMLYATRYQGAEDVAKQNAAYNRNMKQQQYELDVAKHGTEREKIAINQYQKFIDDQMDALIAKDAVLAADPVAKAKARQDIENSQIAVQLRRRAFPDLPAQPTFAGFSAVPSKK
jgi:hypothetical protein